MTKRRLRINLIAAGVYLVALFLFAAANKFYLLFPRELSDSLYQLERDFSALLISLAAAYLSYCFQQRVAFLSALRDLWHRMVEAKNELVAYTENSKPDEPAFVKSSMAISKAIDAMRSVYRNIKEDDKQTGYFPFEPLHDMRRELERLGWSNPDPERMKAARDRIVSSWNALRAPFLMEFATPLPERPITERGAADTRHRN